MELTKAEREMLDGKNGKGTQKCMKLLVTMGEIAGAKKMVPNSQWAYRRELRCHGGRGH